MTVERGLCRGVIGDSRINDDILPTAVFKELENRKSILKSIINNQVLKEL